MDRGAPRTYESIDVFLTRPHFDPFTIAPSVAAGPTHRRLTVRWVTHPRPGRHDHSPALELVCKDDVAVVIHGGTVSIGCSVVTN